MALSKKSFVPAKKRIELAIKFCEEKLKMVDVMFNDEKREHWSKELKELKERLSNKYGEK